MKKLVRDKIFEIIAANDSQPPFCQAEPKSMP